MIYWEWPRTIQHIYHVDSGSPFSNLAFPAVGTPRSEGPKMKLLGHLLALCGSFSSSREPGSAASNDTVISVCPGSLSACLDDHADHDSSMRFPRSTASQACRLLTNTYLSSRTASLRRETQPLTDLSPSTISIALSPLPML